MSQARTESAAPIDVETLFRCYARFVASFLYRLGVRDADLQDLVQDVFVAAHRKGGYLPGAASPTTFLARLALEARRANQRSASRWVRARSDELAARTLGASLDTPERALSNHEAAQRLEQALARMEPGARAVFVLYELEGESCEAIAAGLAVKLGTVYSRLHAARKAFREHMARFARGHQQRSPLAMRNARNST